MTKIEELKFAGDEKLERYGEETLAIIATALKYAIPYLRTHGDPKAAEQAEKALADATGYFTTVEREKHTKPSLPQELSLALAAALIVVEDTLHDHEEEDEKGADHRIVFRLDMEHANVSEWIHFSSLHNKREEAESMVAGLVKKEPAFPKPIITELPEAKAINVLVHRALRRTGRRLVEKTFDRIWVAPDIFLVVHDDTEYCTFPKDLKNKVERVESVYFFDRNQITHICSFEGSYFFEHLENRVVMTEAVRDGDEIEHDRLREKAEDLIGGRGGSADESDYYGDRDTDSFLEEHAADRGKVYHYGNPTVDWDEIDGDDEEAKYKTMMEGLREHFGGNSYI